MYDNFLMLPSNSKKLRKNWPQKLKPFVPLVSYGKFARTPKAAAKRHRIDEHRKTISDLQNFQMSWLPTKLNNSGLSDVFRVWRMMIIKMIKDQFFFFERKKLNWQLIDGCRSIDNQQPNTFNNGNYYTHNVDKLISVMCMHQYKISTNILHVMNNNVQMDLWI